MTSASILCCYWLQDPRPALFPSKDSVQLLFGQVFAFQTLYRLLPLPTFAGRFFLHLPPARAQTSSALDQLFPLPAACPLLFIFASPRFSLPSSFFHHHPSPTTPFHQQLHFFIKLFNNFICNGSYQADSS